MFVSGIHPILNSSPTSGRGTAFGLPGCMYLGQSISQVAMVADTVGAPPSSLAATTASHLKDSPLLPSLLGGFLQGLWEFVQGILEVPEIRGPRAFLHQGMMDDGR